MITRTLVRRNFYCDSVALMKLSRSLSTLADIEDAAAIMSTQANHTLLQQSGLLSGLDEQAELGGPNDLLVVVRANSDEAAVEALRIAESGLNRHTASTEGIQGAERTISIKQAAYQYPALNLALVSVPGSYAAVEARQALLAGLHVLLFSDNVSLEQEVALKTLAAERGLLLMGPDCGTALINGVGLGFANAVPRGPIGIVSASGTGLQQVACLIANYGLGISQAIGTGGRDLAQAVGGRTMLAGLELLQHDPATKVIVLISKPPAPEVVQRVLAAAAHGSKPTVVAFLGSDLTAHTPSVSTHIHFSSTLGSAARLAAHLAGGARPEQQPSTGTAPSGEAELTEEARGAVQWAKAALAPTQRYVRGLFSGGTLCDEAMMLMSPRLGPIYSNIPLRPHWALSEPYLSKEHTAIDFGSDEFTVGRPHPMIDASLRLRRLAQEARDPATAVILFDLVLGYGAHPDPAAEFAPAIGQAKATALQAGRNLACVVSLCGTEQDPQRLSAQQTALLQAGALVFTENAQAALVAAAIASAQPAPPRESASKAERHEHLAERENPHGGRRTF